MNQVIIYVQEKVGSKSKHVNFSKIVTVKKGGGGSKKAKNLKLKCFLQCKPLHKTHFLLNESATNQDRQKFATLQYITNSCKKEDGVN